MKAYLYKGSRCVQNVEPVATSLAGQGRLTEEHL